jgi:hypothetical protein
VASLGRDKDVELIVADCTAEGHLHEEFGLPPAACEMVKVVTIPPGESGGMVALSRSRGLNAAIRRAAGAYVLALSADAIITAPHLQKLLSIVGGTHSGVAATQTLFRVSRRQLPPRQVERRPSVCEWQEYLGRNLTLLPVPDAGYAYDGGDVLMHRSLWETVRGYDESIGEEPLAEIELVLRVSQRYPVLDLGNFGVEAAYLLPIEPPRDGGGLRVWNTKRLSGLPSLAVNEANWGLGDQELSTHRPDQLMKEDAADLTSRIGEIEQWSTSRREVVEQLANPLLHGYLQELMRSLRIDPEPLRPSQKEVNAFAALVWYAQRRAVRTYLETGMRTPYGACLVTRSSPGTEVYAVVDWCPPVEKVRSLLFVNNNFLKAIGQHWGYIRFVGDDPATAVARIISSVPGRFALDLAFVRCGTKFPSAPRQAVELAARLTPGGAMVISAEDEQSFDSAWGALARERPGLTFLRFSDRRSGIVLAASLKE